MTINDLPKRLQVDGMKIVVPGEIVNIHLSDAKMTALEPMIIGYLDRMEKQTKEGA
jgi:hypothetical protein